MTPNGIVIDYVQIYHDGEYHCLSMEQELYQVTSTLFVAGDWIDYDEIKNTNTFMLQNSL